MRWLRLQMVGPAKKEKKVPGVPGESPADLCVPPKSVLKSARGIIQCCTSHMVKHVVDITYAQDK